MAGDFIKQIETSLVGIKNILLQMVSGLAGQIAVNKARICLMQSMM